jgi:hypothetical protein
MKNCIWVALAETEEQKLQAYRIRYEVLVEELGYVMPGCTPETGVREAADAQSKIFVAYEGDKPVGCMAIDWWKEVEMSADRVSDMQLAVFENAYSRNSVFVCRKAAILQEYRSSSAFWKLTMGLAGFASVQHNPHFIFVDCSPELVPFYVKFGFRSYAPAFQYVDGGCSVPMCAVMNDIVYFNEARATLRAVASTYHLPHIPEVARFFKNVSQPCEERLGETA